MHSSHGELSRRQLEAARLLAQGDSKKLVAGALDISARTVACHRAQVMEKLARNAIELRPDSCSSAVTSWAEGARVHEAVDASPGSSELATRRRMGTGLRGWRHSRRREAAGRAAPSSHDLPRGAPGKTNCPDFGLNS